VAFHWIKKNKKWIIKALVRTSVRTVAWVLGGGDAATFQRLYEKVKHLIGCMFYTVVWDAFENVLHKERHIIGKTHTVAIERDNSNTRHHLGRMTRRTKVVSKKEEMVDNAIKMWCALTQPEVFHRYQDIALSIFR
jgi:insertion element IS1 protein InsB